MSNNNQSGFGAGVFVGLIYLLPGGILLLGLLSALTGLQPYEVLSYGFFGFIGLVLLAFTGIFDRKKKDHDPKH